MELLCYSLAESVSVQKSFSKGNPLEWLASGQIDSESL